MLKNKSFLIIGQIPPPFLGQAIMTKVLIDSLSDLNYKFKFINQTSSKNTKSFSRLEIGKFCVVLKTIFSILIDVLFDKSDILYYSPSGHRKIAIIRDIIILTFSRLFYKKVIFHFHAYGLSLVRPKLNFLLRKLFDFSFLEPDLMIKLTHDVNADESLIKPASVKILPNAVLGNPPEIKDKLLFKDKIKLIYVGAIYEERGIDDIIELIHFSKKLNDLDITVDFVGDFMCQKFKSKINMLIDEYDIAEKIKFLGVKINEEKNILIEKAHFLILPSRVPSETFGLVLIEAMMNMTPPVCTDINGPKFIVNHDKNGLKYTPNDIKGLYSSILKCVLNPVHYESLRQNARREYENKYTLSTFKSNVDSIFNSL